MDNEQRKRMADKSGDNNSSRPPKYVVPLIRFNGNTGEFRMVSKNEDNQDVETPITKPVEFVILKKRRNLSAYSRNQSYFSTEHNTVNDMIQLFKVVSGTVTPEDVGFTPDLRAKYQTLKTHEVVYVLYDGQVCKMEIKGGSLGNYYDFQRKLTEEELHSFEVTTILGSKKAENEEGFGYFQMTFDFKPSEADFDLVEAKIDEVSEACKRADDYTKQKISQGSNRGGGNLTVEEAGTIKALRTKAQDDFDNFNNPKSEGDINPNDIPF